MSQTRPVRPAAWLNLVRDPDHGLVALIGDGEMMLARPVTPARAAELGRSLMDYAAAELRRGEEESASAAPTADRPRRRAAGS